MDVAGLGLGEDVLRERERAYAEAPREEHLIVLRDLRKEFPAQDGNPEKTAVENMSVAITRGECFGCGTMRASHHCAFMHGSLTLTLNCNVQAAGAQRCWEVHLHQHGAPLHSPLLCKVGLCVEQRSERGRACR